MARLLPLLALPILLSGCWVNGRPTGGEDTRFASMGDCEAVATRTYQSGYARYPRFRCRTVVLGYVIDWREYEDGRSVQFGPPPGVVGSGTADDPLQPYLTEEEARRLLNDSSP